MKIYRAWINQPSTLQRLNHLHGTKCICVEEPSSSFVTIYFTEGEVHSMVVPLSSITRIKISSAEN